MLFKYTLKNIISKPGRLAVLLLCMTAACLTGYLAIDFSSVLTYAMQGELDEKMGDIDFQLTSFATGGIGSDFFEGSPSVEYVGRAGVNKKEVIRTPERYNYEITESVAFMAFTDFDLARKLRMVNLEKEPEDGTCAISKKYSEKYGYQVGDPIMVLNADQEEVPLTVSEIYDPPKFLSAMSALISMNEYITLKGSDIVMVGYVNVPPESMDEFKKYMEEEHSNVICLNISMPDDYKKQVENISSLLYLIFVLVFVLVIFVTVSFTEKIITERMSVIGTLRSIGMSMRKTAMILLLENVIYGFLGSILALFIYLAVRDELFLLLADMENAGQSTEIPVLKCVLIILGAVLIQVLIPLKEVLKAVNTSIRDIIFDTRDSEYKVSGKKTAAGAALIIAGLVTGFLSMDHRIVIIAVLAVILGAAMVVEFVLKKVTALLAAVFAGAGMPVAELAAKETGTKKPNSGNAVLAVAAVTAAVAIYVSAYSLVNSLNSFNYNADVIVTDTALKLSKYDFINEIEDVTEVTYISREKEDIKVGGVSRSAVIWRLPDSTKYTGLGELPESLSDNEIVLDKMTALKAGVKAGDTVEVVFHDMGIFPVSRNLKVALVTDRYEIFVPCTLVVSETLYKEMFAEYVDTILVSTPDPDKVKEELEASLTKGETVKTNAEMKAETEKNMHKINLGITGIVLLAVAMTLIGISGNQVIGFASRKKEYAMLHSCACCKRDIIKMIWMENAMLFGVSALTALIVSVPVTMLIARVFLLADVGINITLRYDTMFICLVLLWAVTMLTALSPVKSLKKMNTAIEMRYE